MGKIRFKADMDGYRELMNGGAVQSQLEGLAKTAQGVANSMLSPDWGKPSREPDFEINHFTGKKFGANGVQVATNTEHAKRSENKNKTLTKAFHAIGG